MTTPNVIDQRCSVFKGVFTPRTRISHISHDARGLAFKGCWIIVKDLCLKIPPDIWDLVASSIIWYLVVSPVTSEQEPHGFSPVQGIFSQSQGLLYFSHKRGTLVCNTKYIMWTDLNQIQYALI